MKTLLSASLIGFALAAATLPAGAQAPPATPQATLLAALQAPGAAPPGDPTAATNAAAGLQAQTGVPEVVLAGAVGATVGALIGARGLSFAGVPASDRSAHAWRAGLTYGLIGGALSAALAERVLNPAPAGAPSFWWNRWNTPLFAGIALVQALDYTSTADFRDHGQPEWLLTNNLVDNHAAFALTEVAAAGAAIGVCYLLQRTGHATIAHWFAGAYIGAGIASAIGNYRYATTGHDIFGQGGVF